MGEVLLELGMGNGTELGMSIWSPRTRIILSVYDDNNDWKRAEYGSHVEEIDEKC